MLIPQVGTAVEDLDTPCLIVDLDVVERNIKCLMDEAKSLGINVRPHLKTVKSPAMAAKYIKAGAVGGCVAKLSEAEVMIEAGVDDLLITTEIAGEPKVSQLAILAARAPKLKLVIDSAESARAINQRMKEAQRKLLVLVDLNVGQNRCGVETKEDALRVAQEIAKCDHLQLIGIQGYEGHLQMMDDKTSRRELNHKAMQKLVEAADHLRQSGLTIDVVTTGGTGTFRYCAEVKGVTEVQPGSFAFMDTAYTASGAKEFQQGLFCLSTVISKPVPTRAVIDAGMKSLSTDHGDAAPIYSEQKLKYRCAGDEHGILEAADSGAVNLQIGQKLRLIPSHIDTTVNLHDNFYCIRENKLETIWPISARGRVQ